MPVVRIFKSKTVNQNMLINDLNNIYKDILVEHTNLSWGDFPDIEHMKVYNWYLNNFKILFLFYNYVLIGNIKIQGFFFF